MGLSDAGRPQVSVVIPSYNTAEAVLRAAGSVIAHTSSKVEVIVVDDCSSDDTPARLREKLPQVQLIEQPERSGFAAACNTGISTARAPLILLLNSDIIVFDDAIDRMVDFMNKTPADACGLQLVAPDESPQTYSTRVPSFRRVIRTALGGEATKTPQSPPDSPVPVECLQASCLMMTREILDRTGDFDRGFFMYCEDIDWCIRAREAGGRLFFLPHITMTHHRGLSTSADVWRLTIEYHRSLLRLYRKHFASSHAPPVRWLLIAGLAARCITTLVVNVFRRHKSPRW